MVEVKNLCKKYGDFVALDDLNFDVADGEVFGFVVQATVLEAVDNHDSGTASAP